MKHFCIMTSYWILAVFAVSLLLVGLDYSFGDSFFLGVLLVPGCLATRWLIPKIRSEKKHIRIINTVCVIAAILITDILLIIWYHIFRQESSLWFLSDAMSPMMLNPVFLGLIMAVIAYCDYLLSDYLKRKFKDETKSITFTSEYRKVTLSTSEVMYVESRDTEVWIYATKDRTFRNRTPITQWQNILEDGFIRIHRSYLVNQTFVESHDSETVTVGSQLLPISRKNRKEILLLLQHLGRVGAGGPKGLPED
jgi:hypothetical protein